MAGDVGQVLAMTMVDKITNVLPTVDLTVPRLILVKVLRIMFKGLRRLVSCRRLVPSCSLQ